MIFQVEKDNQGIAIVTIDMKDRPINVLGSAFVEGFSDLVEGFLGDESLKGVILTSAKKDFIAGADLDELYATRDPAEAMKLGMHFKKCARQLETMGKPVVAAMNGTALGGGLEVALVCHHRIALDHEKIRFGFPEVTLGLFPGGGGSQRLPRMIGIQAALPILLEGKTMDARAARKAGLVDDLAADKTALMEQAKAWIAAHPEAKQPWDERGFRWPGGHPKGASSAQIWALAPAMIGKKTRANYHAQNQALSAVYEGSQVDFDTADRIETRYFANTVCGPQAKNMLTAFWYQRNAINKGGSRPQGIAPTATRKVGVLGAGMMGSGIAYVTAKAGMNVVLKDVGQAAADKGKAVSRRLLEKKVERGFLTEEAMNQVLDRIETTERAEDCASCDLIIEAVFEDRRLKAEVTKETEAVLSKDAVFASNTSTLPITGLAKESSRPDRFIGLHFFSPVDKMNLVEIIVGEKTSPETLAKAFDFVLAIKKTPIVVNDSRGFYTSRVFSTYVKEGMALLAEGQNPRAIESAGLQAGMPVGPLAVCDEVSLSLMHHIGTQTQKDLTSEGKEIPKHPADAVVATMVEQLNRPGKKAGKGFYDYPAQSEKHLWPGLAQQFPATANPLSQQEMQDRLMIIQALETVRCFQEGVLRSVADANLGSILGWGFAPFSGGTLQFINAMGLERFAEKAQQLADRYGPRFQPPTLLRQMAIRKQTFDTGFTLSDAQS